MEGCAKVPRWIEEGFKRRRDVVFDYGVEEGLDVGRLKCFNDMDEFRKCVKEVLSADVRSGYGTKKVRKGGAFAPAVDVSGGGRLTDGEDGGEEGRGGEGEEEGWGRVNTQQIDNVMVSFRVREREGEWGGSGALDKVKVVGMAHVK
ncbi:hypothetical protein TrCOL_g2197 [Triparma columacea]|uniref:Uncharacterized protein n=1 Tax=Triparma columacea TaxID=722753 RepID=A0A9W7G259_9STRA|nr:hypothetical protein TrCOL_g2197 [Triparma columacea]